MSIKVPNEFRLGLNTGFAVNRYSEPEEWVRIIGDELGVEITQFTADMLNVDLSKKIIYTSSSSLALNKINLKDLHSRLSWGLVYRINNSDDCIKEKILNKIIHERDYNISLDVCSYLLNRKDRDLVSLIEIIHKIGYYSLSTNKKVSIKSLSDIFN